MIDDIVENLMHDPEPVIRDLLQSVKSLNAAVSLLLNQFIPEEKYGLQCQMMINDETLRIFAISPDGNELAWADLTMESSMAQLDWHTVEIK